MGLRDRAKQALRMCGHALTSTVHDRLDVLERELRIAKLVETNEALLQASIHTVENLHALAGQTIVETEPSPISAETALMAFLYSHVPARTAVEMDGADQARTEALLRAGYEVYALEAVQTAGKLAITRRNGSTAHVARASGVAEAPGVSRAAVATLGASSASVTGAIPLDRPQEIGLLLLGCDPLPMVREFGDCRASVITADLDSDFEELAAEMRSREYHWHVVLYRTREAGEDDATDRNGNHMQDGAGMSYYANHSRALPNSRGSVFFFRDYRVFAEAQSWCAATLPRTYFKPRQA
jgi:hypothetical protein